MARFCRYGGPRHISHEMDHGFGEPSNFAEAFRGRPPMSGSGQAGVRPPYPGSKRTAFAWTSLFRVESGRDAKDDQGKVLRKSAPGKNHGSDQKRDEPFFPNPVPQPVPRQAHRFQEGPQAVRIFFHGQGRVRRQKIGRRQRCEEMERRSSGPFSALWDRKGPGRANGGKIGA